MVGERCKGECAYCTGGNNFLSRVRWPSFSIVTVLERLEEKRAERICIQSLYYDGFFHDILFLTKKLAKYDIPISVSMNPTSEEHMKKMKKEGVERVGIGLDCSTEKLFNKWKKNVPSWENYLYSLQQAKQIFGSATAHLIVGLGESDKELIDLMRLLAHHGINIALFAFTPVRMLFPPPPVDRYRALQIARYWIERGEGRFYFEKGKLNKMIVPANVEAFRTSGCPSCNRPFYNERASGPFYNYPHPMNSSEILTATKEARKYVKIYTSSK
jgi:biotin synthase